MSDRWLILGAGYAGTRLARTLAHDDKEVWATVRTREDAMTLEASGVKAICIDFEDESLQQSISPTRSTVAVLSIPPSREDGESLVEARAVQWAKAQGAERVVYWSSTSVYGSSGGDRVDESTFVAPNTRVGMRRLAAEERVRDACARAQLSLAIVRIVGIYGPHRNMKQRLERGDYAMADGGEVFSNRIHVDDIASATRFIAKQAAFEGVWLLSDGHSFQVKELVQWMVQKLGVPMPPSIPLAQMDVRRRAFWTGNRRVTPRRLIDAGWQPRYSSYREGMAASWEEEQGKK